jgi:hypothetical protein
MPPLDIGKNGYPRTLRDEMIHPSEKFNSLERARKIVRTFNHSNTVPFVGHRIRRWGMNKMTEGTPSDRCGQAITGTLFDEFSPSNFFPHKSSFQKFKKNHSWIYMDIIIEKTKVQIFKKQD